MKTKFVVWLILYFHLVIQGQDSFYLINDRLNRALIQENTDSLKLVIYNQLIEHWKKKNFNTTIDYIKQAIAFSEKNNLTNYIDGFKVQLGFQYMQVGDAVRSIEIFNDLKKNLDPVTQAEYYQMCLAFIGMNYENIGDFKKALEYTLSSRDITDELWKNGKALDRRGILGNPHKIAVYYLKMNQLDSALQYGKLAEDRLRLEPLTDYNRFFSWYIKTTMGDIYTKLKNYNLAMANYIVAEDEIKNNNSKEDIPPLYMGMSRLYADKKKFEAATRYALEAFQVADTLRLYPLMMESSFLLKDIYTKRNKMDSAFYYYDQGIKAKDTIFNANIARKIDAYEFEEEKKKTELASLLLKEKNRKKQNMLGLAGVLSLLGAGFFFQQNRIKQKQNKILVLEKIDFLRQRELLKQEVEKFETQALKAQLNPHFIFNCINSIDALIFKDDKFRATTYLNRFARLLRNILDQSKSQLVTLTKEIDTITLYLDLEKFRHNNKFEYYLNLDSSVNPDAWLVPPMLCQPILENAILHGLKNKEGNDGRLEIRFTSTEADQLTICIHDSGIGRKAAALIPSFKENSYGTEIVVNRLIKYNKDQRNPMLIEDLYDEHYLSLGTRVTLSLNKINSYDSYQNNCY